MITRDQVMHELSAEVARRLPDDDPDQWGRIYFDARLWTEEHPRPESDSEWTQRAWRRRALKAVRGRIIPVVAAAHDVDPEAFATMQFSKTAGCPCGCSPGFVAKEIEAMRGTDTWVHPTAEHLAEIFFDRALRGHRRADEALSVSTPPNPDRIIERVRKVTPQQWGYMALVRGLHPPPSEKAMALAVDLVIERAKEETWA